MNEILSQSQIDDLLSAISTGEVKYEDTVNVQKKVKKYDFSTPKRLTKEELRTLLSIFENYSRFLGSYFSGVLRTFVDIQVMSVEEQRYYEYNNALPDSVMMGVLDILPIEGTCTMDVSRQIIYSILERLLGGVESGYEPEREFSDIEVAVMERIYKQMVSYLRDAWSNVAKVEPEFRRNETNARLLQLYRQDQVVVIVAMNLSIKSVKGSISFCLPCINIENVLKPVSTTAEQHAEEDPAAIKAKGALISNLKDTSIEVVGILGEATLTLDDIVNLEEGDVIQLDQGVGSKIRIDVEDSPRFYGLLGVKKNKKVVKICDII